MTSKSKAKAISIYISASDHRDGEPLYAVIVQEAKKRGLSGATVLRAMMGFGAHSRIHSTNILVLSEDLPVVITLIDTPEKIDEFLPVLELMVGEGTVVSCDVNVEVFRERAQSKD